jgi:hypothetical protein
MNNKSLLIPHPCKKTGWALLLLSLLLTLANGLFVHDIHVAWWVAKVSHFALIISLFLICLSREKVEDEMISSLRLRAVGVTAYVFFVIFLILSLVLDLNVFSHFSDTLGAFLSEVLLIILPVLLFGLYYVTFKGMLRCSRKEERL